MAYRQVGASTTITDKLFQDVVAEALRQLHGYIGGAVHTELLLLTEAIATVKVDKRLATRHLFASEGH